MPRPQDEKRAFSQRLKQALKRSHKKVETPTELATQFNLRYKGGSISNQAAQKWLTGLSLPTVDKMDVLADWLNVSAQWLRHGIAEERPSMAGRKSQAKKTAAAVQPTVEELKLLARIRNLSEHRRNLVAEIIEQFALEQEMWRE